MCDCSYSNPAEHAADQPAHSVSGVVKSESQVALAFRKNSSHDRLEERVLRGIAEPPQQHSDQRKVKPAKKHQR